MKNRVGHRFIIRAHPVKPGAIELVPTILRCDEIPESGEVLWEISEQDDQLLGRSVRRRLERRGDQFIFSSIFMATRAELERTFGRQIDEWLSNRVEAELTIETDVTNLPRDD